MTRDKKKPASGGALLELLLVALVVGLLAVALLGKFKLFGESSAKDELLQSIPESTDVSRLDVLADPLAPVEAADEADPPGEPRRFDAPLPIRDGSLADTDADDTLVTTSEENGVFVVRRQKKPPPPGTSVARLRIGTDGGLVVEVDGRFLAPQAEPARDPELRGAQRLEIVLGDERRYYAIDARRFTVEYPAALNDRIFEYRESGGRIRLEMPRPGGVRFASP